ncbi:MAG: hypothetical protein A2W26_12675 [Acidobacteria bacterium RBG_16_64_8]|nr:MAG: hypothetical protein A2W26_12675 [Acidobacteria bacterium RBG_16_64_8]
MARIAHFEIVAKDVERARKFYEQAFDWKFEQWGGIDYWLATTGPEGEPGINGAITSDMGMNQSVIDTVVVQSLDDSVDRVVAAGGSVVRPRTEVPGMGFVAYCKDTEGNVVGIFEPSMGQG